MKKFITAVMIGSFCVLFGMGGTALAQTQPTDSQSDQTSASQYKPNLTEAYKSMNELDRKHIRFNGLDSTTSGTAIGKIVGIRTVEFENGQSYVLVKISNNRGDDLVLNLGTVQHLQKLNADLGKGNMIMARGQAGRINDKPILVVQAFRIGDGTPSNRMGYQH